MFLDEPTLGLDPNTLRVMWNYIRNLVREENLSVILTTHYMEEAEQALTELASLTGGRIIVLTLLTI